MPLPYKSIKFYFSTFNLDTQKGHVNYEVITIGNLLMELDILRQVPQPIILLHTINQYGWQETRQECVPIT